MHFKHITTNFLLQTSLSLGVFVWPSILPANILTDHSTDKLTDKSMHFAVGRSLFKKLWIASPSSTKASDGLGPLYNARSCFQCHINAGRGQIPLPINSDIHADKHAVSILMHLSIPPQNEADKNKLQTHQQNSIPEPIYGTQFQTSAVTGLASEGDLHISYTDLPIKLEGGEVVVLHKPDYQLTHLQYGDMHPKTLISPRLAPPLVGMGKLDAISEQDILQLCDPNDTNKDGISGKPNRVWSKAFNKVMLGRFGYKAGIATLDEQNQNAFTKDIGLSTPLFPNAWGDCTDHQAICRNAPHGDNASQPHLEAPQKVTDAVLYYVAHLSLPEKTQHSNSDVLEGQKIFQQTGCTACHRPSFQLGQKLISPYSDMLLHDMGEALADHRPEGLATGQEWRTAPLWGIGLTEQINGHHFYLHDGRARSLQEAILWHGGEAQHARNQFLGLDKQRRQQLLVFIESL